MRLTGIIILAIAASCGIESTTEYTLGQLCDAEARHYCEARAKCPTDNTACYDTWSHDCCTQGEHPCYVLMDHADYIMHYDRCSSVWEIALTCAELTSIHMPLVCRY